VSDRVQRDGVHDVVHPGGPRDRGVVSDGRDDERLAGVPVIVNTAHNTYYWKGPRDLRIEAWLSRWTDRIVCVSEAVREFEVQQNPRIPAMKFKTIYNGIDTARYFPRNNGLEMRRRFGLAPEHLVIGFVGRLVPQKKLEDLIEAAAHVVRCFPQARFLVLGEGPLGPKLQQEAERRGLASFFRFAGVVHDAENGIQAFDVLAQLASREGFGLSMAEAMASGIPPVAANAAPIPEVVQHGRNGFVFDVGDVAGLVRCVNLLLADPELRRRLGSQAALDVSQRFPISATATNYHQLYQELLAEKDTKR
jgi:glycosyltransferase involved in cell wall biosynthesis